ncbi:hypothetical protein NP233_g3840 [Leucocoprinus birnbaumii]|uniref:F-box domain-containing protein n=1 Tax=Leucocoprinus birnbaumii TaxID=56174 RepID=A0AAD5VYF7_9AGAR|nr:hypothetical protein NP233_g3840 [Leucocoprinus birnbaumii]
MESFRTTHPELVTGSFDNPDTELAYLDSLVDDTQGRINELHQFLVRLHRRRNQIKSRIYTLPPEVLSRTFLFVCFPGGTGRGIGREEDGWERFGLVDRSSITLSSVSSQWRQVALGTSELWASITLVIVKRDNISTYASLLRLYLARSQIRDISLDIMFNGSYFDLPSNLIVPITRILFSSKTLDRILTLRVQNPPEQWMPLISKLTRVETLCLTYPMSISRGDSTLDLHIQPLRRLHLVGSQWASADLPKSLQYLSLETTYPNFELGLLRQCPNLIECHARNQIPWQGFTNASVDVPLAFDHLSSFTWSLHAGINDGSASRNLFLPALRHLHLVAPESASGKPVIDFIHKHSKMLISLNIEQFIEWSSREYADLFQCDMPCLCSITVNAPFADLVSCMEALMQKSGARGDFPDSENVVVPMLSSLRLSEANPEDEDYTGGIDKLASVLLEMLRTRRAGEVSRFEVDVPELDADFQEDLWPLEVQKDLKGYISEHRVRLTQDSNIPYFLDGSGK